MKNYSGKFILLLSLMLITAVAWAAGEQKITLKPGPDGKRASGEAVVKDLGGGQSEISITAKGLKPDSVYTVWFVNEKPKMDMAGVGEPDYELKSDSRGNGKYSATVSTDELKKWQLLELALHPDRDPKNMKNIKIALKGDIKMK